jgi:hypothetical protein
MQDSARQDTLFSSLSLDRFPISFVSRIYPVYDSHDWDTLAISGPIEGLMSLSFWMGRLENSGHDGSGHSGHTGLGICVRISQ